MKIMLFSALAGSVGLVCLASNHNERWPVRDQETIQKTLVLSEAPMRLVVDNIEGYVHVTGVAGSEVRVTAHKTIRAETDSDLQQGKSEVNLKLEQKPGTVSAYYDAPWRCDGDSGGCHDHERRFYDVAYDIDVEVPAAAHLYVSAVNGGDIHIDKTRGDFEVRDINGGIHMSDIVGSGSVNTINGPVTVHFAQNPIQPSSFKSINGSLDVWFQQALSADLLFKTFNGQVYSDFEVAPRAVPATVVTERRDGKFVYRSNGVSGGRTGNGGAELSFDTLNGSVRLHREK